MVQQNNRVSVASPNRARNARVGRAHERMIRAPAPLPNSCIEAGQEKQAFIIRTAHSPMSFVRKKKNAESLDGVACHRKTKSAGSQTDFCLMARNRAAACSDTTCFGLSGAPETIFSRASPS